MMALAACALASGFGGCNAKPGLDTGANTILPKVTLAKVPYNNSTSH